MQGPGLSPESCGGGAANLWRHYLPRPPLRLSGPGELELPGQNPLTVPSGNIPAACQAHHIPH